MNYSEIAHDVAELWHCVDVVEVCSTHVVFSIPRDSEQIVAALYDSIFDCGGYVKDAPPVVEVFENYNEITFYWENGR
jgi:hypothetical protein